MTSQFHDSQSSAAAKSRAGGDALHASANGVGDLLLAMGKLNATGLERALRAQHTSGDRLDRVLVTLGLVGEADMAEALASLAGLPLLGVSDYPAEALLEDRISTKFLKQAKVLPVRDAADGLVLAMADPFDAEAALAVELFVGKRVQRAVGKPGDVEAALERLYGGEGEGAAPGAAAQDGGAADVDQDEDVQRLKDMASEAPVIRLVNQIIARAVEAKASDIHFEPYHGRFRLRYRIDGVLREFDSPPVKLASAIISRVKIMSKLNIAERRLPQDGRVKLAVRGKEIDFRVATMPTMHGEHVVMRILDRGSIKLDFAALGFTDAVLARYRAVLARPHGILLVTGPTGSGKTTTLYTSLQELNTPDVNILTVEDPVEYQLEGVNQVQVKPQIGLTFAAALRAFLRQDPDIILIGEIRDTETAQIAVQAALTGHLVLSTLHTNNAASSISRLLDMGVEDYLMNSTINGILAQRLVRTLCPACRESYRPSPEMVAQLQIEQPAGEVVFHRAKGCARCSGTGYSGRSCIIEFLTMSEAIARLVLKRAEARDIQRQAVEEGMRTMYQDGMAKALAGLTTPEEVLRVIRGE
jgi:general secretion pathway protein E